MKIRWLRKALLNLNAEAEYIAQDDPAAAQYVVERIHAAVALLAENPALGRPGRVPRTRELIVPQTRYIVPYRVNAHENQVEILRVFHASRKTPERW